MMDAAERLSKEMQKEMAVLRRLVTELNSERTERERVLNQLRRRLQFNEIIVDISKHFIDLNPKEISAGILHALDAIGNFLEADCGHLFMFRENNAKLVISHSWSSQGGCDTTAMPHRELTTDQVPWLMDRLKNRLPINLRDSADLPRHAGAEKKLLDSADVRSCIAAPVLWSQTLVGFVVFATVTAERAWPEHVAQLLVSAGQVFANALEHKRMDTSIFAAARMDATAKLAGGLAHEFNNLMTSVVGNAEVLHKRLSDQPDTMRILGDIMSAGRQASDLCRQIVAFARGGKYLRERTSLSDIVRRVIDLRVQNAIDTVTFDCDLEPDLPEVMADPSQINHVIDILCDNAVEAIEVQGNVTVKTRSFDVDPAFAESHPGLKPGMYVCLSVEDTGCGIDDETIGRVFEPFFTTKFQGRGLGLSAAYGIVKNHDGHIAVSRRTGGGTMVNIYLPVAETEEPASCEPETEQPSDKHDQQTTVLLVDDDELVVETTTMMLEHLGYKTIPACNGQKAVEIARSQPNDIGIVLLDLAMPVMNGAAAFPLLRIAAPNAKIIICSGYELDGVSQKLLDDGAVAFLQKPFQMADLDSLLKQVTA